MKFQEWLDNYYAAKKRRNIFTTAELENRWYNGECAVRVARANDSAAAEYVEVYGEALAVELLAA